MHANGFDPSAAYRVCNRRGFTYGPRQFGLGDRVTTAEIDANTLFTLYRYRFVERAPVTAETAPAAKPSQMLAEQLRKLGKPELKRLCELKGIDAGGNETQLRNRLLAMVG